jgi:hypothetical protein
LQPGAVGEPGIQKDDIDFLSFEMLQTGCERGSPLNHESRVAELEQQIVDETVLGRIDQENANRRLRGT